MIVFWNSIRNYLAGYSNTWFLFLFSYWGYKDGGLRSEFWYHVGELIPKILLTLIGNPGKLIQKCFRNFSFPGCDTDGFLENSSSIFSKSQFPGYELDRFLENSSINFLWVLIQYIHIWMSFPEIGLWHAPDSFECHFSTKGSILDEFSRNRPVSCGMTHAPKF